MCLFRFPPTCLKLISTKYHILIKYRYKTFTKFDLKLKQWKEPPPWVDSIGTPFPVVHPLQTCTCTSGTHLYTVVAARSGLWHRRTPGFPADICWRSWPWSLCGLSPDPEALLQNCSWHPQNKQYLKCFNDMNLKIIWKTYLNRENF